VNFPRQVVATNGRALTSAYSKYLRDKDVVTAAVTLDGAMLRHAAPELRADAEVVLAAVTQVPIIKVVDALEAAEATISARYAGPELVAALEDHIPGFSPTGCQLLPSPPFRASGR
jgi:hypothetical protein